MKIKELHLRNIASIEKADIDFEKDLCDGVTGEEASIFLISGDTGTGKSVILDGIAMALYKKTPRIVDAGNKKNNTFVTREGEDMKVGSLEQYSRLGIGPDDECYSKLVFEDNHGTVCTTIVKLGYSRSTKKDADGNRLITHSKPTWTIIEDGSEQKCTEEIIVEKIGLTFEQFSRMAMLAQGQFAKFLTGDKTEREAILEQLTNTSHFSAYGEAISRLWKQAKTDHEAKKQLKEQASQYVLPKEKVEELTTQQKEIGERQTKVQQQMKHCAEQLELVTVIENQESVLTQNRERQQALQTEQKGASYLSQQKLVAQWSATEKERNCITELDNACTELDVVTKRERTLQQTFGNLMADLLFRRHTRDLKQKDLDAQSLWLKAREARKEIYTGADVVLLRVKHYLEDAKSLADKTRALQTEKSKTEELQKSLEAAGERQKKAEEQVRLFDTQIGSKTQERNQLNPTVISQQLLKVSESRTALTTLSDNLTELAKQQEAAGKEQQELNKAEVELQALITKKKAAEDEHKEAERLYNESNNRLITMNMSLETKLVELRARLVEEHTEVCPLCGQNIDFDKIERDFGSLLTPLQEEKGKREEARIKAKALCDKVVAEWNGLSAGIAERRKGVEAQKSKIEKEKRRLAEKVLALGLDAEQDVQKQIEASLSTLSSEEAKLQAKQQKATEIQKEIDALLETRKPADKELYAAREQVARAHLAVDNNSRNISSIEEEIQRLDESVVEQKRTLDGQLKAFYPEWESGIEAFKETFQSDATDYCSKQKQYDEGKERYDDLSKLISDIELQQKPVADAHPQWATDAEACEWKCASIMGEWNKLCSDIAMVQSARGLHEQKKVQCEDVLKTYVATHNETIESLRALMARGCELEHAKAYCSGVDQELAIVQNTIKTAEAECRKALEQLVLEDGEERPKASVLREEHEKLNEEAKALFGQLVDINTQLTTNNENITRFREAKTIADEAAGKFERWNLVNKYFGGSRFRTLVQTHILRPLLNNANLYLERITDRYRLTCHEDNEQLSILVLDRYNRNQVRSVTILSGGERFMISLALSLALSSLNRPDMNVNILFIDEGFGTLDDKSLDSVMSTLEKLQEIAGQSNRRVGVISHRTELDERIPVQINLTRNGEGRSKVDFRH